MVQWCYQIMKGKSEIDLLVVSIYQSCRHQGTNNGMTFHTQQQLMLLELDRPNLHPRTNFHKDLQHFIKQHVDTPDTTRIPIIRGDWNEECSGTSTFRKLCDLLGLVDLWKYRNPDQAPFKTYHWGNYQINFALTTSRLVSLAVNMVYEPFFYRASGDHRESTTLIPVLCSITLSPPLDPPLEDFLTRTITLLSPIYQNSMTTWRPTMFSNGSTC